MTETTPKPTLDLSHFTGSENHYQHWSGLRYTEGVRYVAETAGAYWLIDAIASYQPSPKVRRNQRLQEFQLWVLEVDTEAKTGKLSLFEDSDEPAILIQKIGFTDFPEKSIKLYVENGVVLLPNEH